MANNSSSIDSSAIEEISPSSQSSLVTLAKIRLIIFPDLVFGRPLTGWITSGAASAPILSRAICLRKIIKKKVLNSSIYYSFKCRAYTSPFDVSL